MYLAIFILMQKPCCSNYVCHHYVMLAFQTQLLGNSSQNLVYTRSLEELMKSKNYQALSLEILSVLVWVRTQETAFF